MNKLLTTGFLLGMTTFVVAMPAQAQKVRTDAIDKLGGQGAQFYHAPRQIDITDDRPIIRDFREAPSAAQTVDLPPGPQGFGGGGGGRQMGDNSLPTGGMPIAPGAGQAGYRTPSNPMGALPKSGFGGSNIPARGMGPRGALPGVTQGVVGKMMNQNKGAGAGAPQGLGSRGGRSAGNSASTATAAKVYSGGYGSGSGNSVGDSSRTESNVRGRLLK